MENRPKKGAEPQQSMNESEPLIAGLVLTIHILILMITYLKFMLILDPNL